MLDIRKEIVGENLVFSFKPLWGEERMEYVIQRPDIDWEVYESKTATMGMKVYQMLDEEFMEWLSPEGYMMIIKKVGDHLGDLNFINIGWQRGNSKCYWRIDPYGGVSKWITDGS